METVANQKIKPQMKYIFKNRKIFNGKILIVDDEACFRLLAEKILSEDGYNCYCAENVRKAMILVEQEDIDIVASDINMPGGSGLELCKYLKSRHPDVAIMLLTAIDDLDLAQEAITYDIYGYLIKPISANQLKISVANAMRRKQLETREAEARDRLKKIVDEKTARLRLTNDELMAREEELQELNTALKVLLRKIQEEKEDIETNVLENVNRSILPYLENVRSSTLNKQQKKELDIALKNLNDIVSPFNRNLSATAHNLSPSEIQVANLIKQGMPTKEIALKLNLSINTIMTHRAHIREKLNIRNQKENLFSLLSSMQ